MLGPVLVLGSLVALVALALRRESDKKKTGASTGKSPARGGYIDEGTPKPFSKGLPAEVKRVIIRQVKDKVPPTKTELEVASEAATSAGFTMLGEELSKKADEAPETIGKKVGLPSPIQGVSDDAWTGFVRKMKVGNPEDIDDKGNVGMFGMTVRRLTDLGIFKDPKKVGGVWNANWQVPKQQLLSSPNLQYKLFEKSMLGHVGFIKNKLDKGIGIQIQGKKSTLSGLLAVAHRAGAEGMKNWVSSPEQQAKFPGTTALYLSMNGIF